MNNEELKFKGTTGEWLYRKNQKEFTAVDAFNEDKSFCVVYISEMISEEEIANAKLIAAAPDLLEALKLSNEWLIKVRDMFPQTELGDILSSGIEQNTKAIEKALI